MQTAQKRSATRGPGLQSPSPQMLAALWHFLQVGAHLPIQNTSEPRAYTHSERAGLLRALTSLQLWPSSCKPLDWQSYA